MLSHIVNNMAADDLTTVGVMESEAMVVKFLLNTFNYSFNMYANVYYYCYYHCYYYYYYYHCYFADYPPKRRSFFLYDLSFWFKFLWYLSSQAIQVDVSHDWLKQWLDTEQTTSHYLNQSWLSLQTYIYITVPPLVEQMEHKTHTWIYPIKYGIVLLCFVSVNMSSVHNGFTDRFFTLLLFSCLVLGQSYGYPHASEATLNAIGN